MFPNNKIPKELIRHFIRGYFDGDGCVCYSERKYIDKRNMKEYTNKQFLVSIVGTKNFLHELINQVKTDINVNFKFNKNPHCGKAEEIKLTRRNDMVEFYKYIYKDAAIYLDRKYDKFLYGFNKLSITP